MVRFIGNRWVQSCDKRFKKKKGGHTFSDSDWLDETHKGNKKKVDFNIARTPTTVSCIFAPGKGIPEES